MIVDYPFKSWATLYLGFEDILNTEFTIENFPQLSKHCDKYGFQITQLIGELLDKPDNNPQEGLDGFIRTAKKGSRYFHNYKKEEILKVFQMFIKEGAYVNLDIILEQYSIDIKFYEEQRQQCSVIAQLLTALVEIPRYTKEWENVKKCYNWEKLSIEEFEEDPVGFIDGATYADRENLFMGFIKAYMK
jgi:hypothetical protein